MWKKVSFGIFITACIIGIIYWLIYVREIKAPVSDPIKAVPTNAAFIFESNQIKSTWNKLSNTNIIWEELLGTEVFSDLNRQAIYMDSLIQTDPAISSLLEEHPILISAHGIVDKKFAFLFTYSLPNLTHRPTFENFVQSIEKGKRTEISEFNTVTILRIPLSGKKNIYCAEKEGTIMISFEKKLIEASIQQLLSDRSLVDNNNFKKIMEASGKKVDANLYINYSSFPTILDPFLKTKADGIASFADCSGWDITIKPNAVMLNGFSQVNDSIPSFLSAFNEQKSQKIEITKVTPSNASLMIYYGVSDMHRFQNSLQQTLDHQKNTDKDIPVHLKKMMLDWMNNEMALILTDNQTEDPAENAYAIIRADNIDEALQSLASVSDSLPSEEISNSDSSRFNGYSIKCLGHTGFLSSLFGTTFSRVKNNYYTSLEDYVVFANSKTALEDLINEFESNKVLSEDRNYQAFSENLSAEANYYIYTSVSRSENIYSGLLGKKYASELRTKKELLSKFEAGAIQFSNSNGSYYSNAYFKYNPEFKKETGTIWEFKLDTTISSKPYLLINHNTKAREVFVQDDANKIYLISNTGKIIWTKQLHEKIMSNVVQVDVLKNDKLQMVFNTRSAIYMFDRNGNEMKGFPIKLKSPATNAISVIDYENNRDYRIFIALANKSIVCYQTNGERLEGFRFDKTKDLVYIPIQYFNAAAKDHLCAIDVKGNIYILNRQGEIRVKMREQTAQGIRNFFVEPGKDYKRTSIISADTLGNIIRIGLTGEKENIKVQDFETSPYFEYRDIQNDKTKEYIFLTRKELKVFSQDRSLLFVHEFKELVANIPVLFQFPDGKTRIGVVSEASDELFLFNDNGSVSEGFPVSGKTLFSIGDLNNEGHFNLISGSSFNSIFVYQVR